MIPLKPWLLLLAALFICCIAPAQALQRLHIKYCLEGDYPDNRLLEFENAEKLWNEDFKGLGNTSEIYDYTYAMDENGNLLTFCTKPSVPLNPATEQRTSFSPKKTSIQKIYLEPIPAKEELMVHGAFFSSVYFFDSFGKQVYFIRLGSDVKVDVSSIPCGIYTLKIDKGGTVYTLPLLIQR